eukprot:1198607-Prymnesium_polylepis.1
MRVHTSSYKWGVSSYGYGGKSGEGPPNRPPSRPPRGETGRLLPLAWLGFSHFGGFSRAAPARLRLFSGFPGGVGRHQLFFNALETEETLRRLAFHSRCLDLRGGPSAEAGQLLTGWSISSSISKYPILLY